MSRTIFQAIVLVVLVIYLFLRSARATVIPAVSIPVSIIGTFAVMQALGFTINNLSLFGLVLAIGIVVDDAIVDVENVYRRLRENAALPEPKPRLEVIAAASSEVRSSILYATILIVLVFVPLLGLAGLEGRLFRPIAIVFIVRIIRSIAVTVCIYTVVRCRVDIILILSRYFCQVHVIATGVHNSSNRQRFVLTGCQRAHCPDTRGIIICTLAS